MNGQGQVVVPPNTGDVDYSDEIDVDRPGIRVQVSPCTRYTELGSTVEAWDWRAERYDLVYFQDNNPNPTERSVFSPYYSAGNNINHLGFGRVGLPDYEPAEGWELLYRNFGTLDRPVQEPSYDLYNRLDGRIRILFYIEPNDGSGPNNVLIRLNQLITLGTSKATAIFENLNVPANAASNFDKDISIGGMVQLNEGLAGLQWYILEGIASYDPCICQHESALEIQPVLTQITTLSFNMEGTGESEAIYDAKDPVSALGNANGLFGKISSGFKKYETTAKYLEDANANDGKSIKIFSGVLGGFAQSLGVVGGITDLLGLVLGKKTTTSAPKLTGYNHNFSFIANGGLEETAAYDPHFIYSPGSFLQEGQLEAYRPVYDNPLGIFTVLEPPVVEKQVTKSYSGTSQADSETTTTTRWRFAGDIKYSVNTIAGIAGQPVQLHASLVWPNGCEEGNVFYATPAINITCLEEFVVEFANTYETEVDPATGEVYFSGSLSSCVEPPQLQIVAMLESNGPTPGQEILYTARYVTEVQEVPEGTIGDNPFANMTIQEISVSCNEVIPAPMNGFKLGRFCASKYNPDLDKNRLEEIIQINNGFSNEEEEEITAFSAFPNPFSNQLNLKLPKDWLDVPLQIQLRDVLGRVIWENKRVLSITSSYTISDELDEVSAGTYFLTVSGKDFVETLIVQK